MKQQANSINSEYIDNDASNLKEVAQAKKVNAVNDKLRDAQKEFNEFDGLLHKKDGKVIDPMDNSEVKSKSHH